MIEPVSEDFTMLTRPACKAKPEMMISGAFPSVALSRPPTVGTQKSREGLGGVAHQPRQGNDCQRRSQEHQDRTGPEPVQADSDRQEYQQPVQGHRVAPSAAWFLRPRSVRSSRIRSPGRCPQSMAKPSRSSATTCASARMMIDSHLRRGLQCAAGASSERPRIASARWLAACAPSIRPRTAALFRGIARATKAAGNTTPYETA